MRTKRWQIARASNPKKTLGTITFRGRSKKELLRNARAFSKRHNIEMGFFGPGGFHPIRASKDYSGARAGEGRSHTAKKVRAGKARRSQIRRVISR